MPTIHHFRIPEATLEIGTDEEAGFGDRTFFVTARTAGNEVRQWGPLTGKRAHQVFDSLSVQFKAMGEAYRAFTEAVQEIPTPTEEGGREIYFPPEQVNLGRYGSGCDYSRDRLLLVRYGRKELWWMKSGKYWSGRGSQATARTELVAVDTTPTVAWHDGKKTRIGEEGGRLSTKRIAQHAKEINDFFGFAVAQHIRPDGTVLVSDVQKGEAA
jgi:hypothetical protein